MSRTARSIDSDQETANFLGDDVSYKAILDNLSEGVYFLDRNRIITYWNKGAERLSGYSAEEVIGRSCADNVLMHVDQSGRQLCLQGCPMAATMADGDLRDTEVYMHHKDGHRVPVRVHAAPVRNRRGEILGAVEIFSDNSEKIAALEQVKDLTEKNLTDELTGIGNRRLSAMTIRSRLSEYKRYGFRFGVMFLDIDHFKSINDTYGHDVGDKVIRMVAKTLSSSIRNFDFVGRWGGEEFVAVLAQVDEELLKRIAERARALIEKTFYRHDGEIISPTVSVGGTIVQDGDTVKGIVKRADALMYESKELGRNRVTLNV